MRTISYLGLCLGVWTAILGSMLNAAGLPNPRLTSVFPAGAQQGSTVQVSVAGIDLEQVAGLVFSHPGITAVQRTVPPRSFEDSPQPVLNEFIVTVLPDVLPGTYDVRALGRNGLSSPRAFKVSDLHEVQCDQKNTLPVTAMKVDLNSIINCRSNSADSTFYYELPGRSGQRFLIRCESRSIDSRMMAMMELLDAQGTTIAFGRATNYREALIDFTPPADGSYILKIYDITYRAGPAFHYRLEISQRPEIDFAWPPIGIPGSTNDIMLYGQNLPEGVPAREFDPRWKLDELKVSATLPVQARPFCMTAASLSRNPHEIEISGFDYQLTNGKLPSSPIFISAARGQVMIEREPNDDPAQPHALTLPGDVVGRIFPSRDMDYFSFTGVKGETYSIDVYSERLNLPTDLALAVTFVTQDAAGNQVSTPIQTLDDQTDRFNNPPFDALTHDPALRFTAAADGLYRIQMRGLATGANPHPRNMYRMIISQPRGNFQLLVTSRQLVESTSEANPQRAAAPTLRRGGSLPFVVQAYRQDGWTGPITLSATGLPSGVTCPSIVIPPGQTQATMIMSAALDAPEWHGTFQVKGIAEVDGAMIERSGVGAAILWDKNHAWEQAVARVIGDLELAIIPEVAPLTLMPATDQLWETCRAGKLTVPAKFDRHLPTSGDLKLEIRGLPTSAFPLNRVPAQMLDSEARTGNVEFAIPSSLAPGDYPGYFTAHTRVTYARNPEGAEAAAARKTEFEALIARLTTESAQATAARDLAEKQLTDLTSMSPDPEQSPEKAVAVSDAQAAVKQASEVAAKAQEVLAAAQAELPQIAKRATDLANIAKPSEIEVFAASPPLVIRVHDLPVKLEVASTVVVQSGIDQDIPITFERMFDCKEPISVAVKLPAGIAGLGIATVIVPGSEQSGILVAKTTRETPPGEYHLVLVTRVTYNGQDLEAERPLLIRVETRE